MTSGQSDTHEIVVLLTNGWQYIELDHESLEQLEGPASRIWITVRSPLTGHAMQLAVNAVMAWRFAEAGE